VSTQSLYLSGYDVGQCIGKASALFLMVVCALPLVSASAFLHPLHAEIHAHVGLMILFCRCAGCSNSGFICVPGICLGLETFGGTSLNSGWHQVQMYDGHISQGGNLTTFSVTACVP